jgi:hypothetical protein
MLRKLYAMAALAWIAVLPAASAKAEIRYDFTAFSSFAIPPYGEFTGSFTYYSPTFIVPDATIPAADMSSCSTNLSAVGDAGCSWAEFDNDVSPPDTTIVLESGTPAVGAFYYFDSAAFSTLGTHDTVLFGDDQAGELVVTEVGVPEPATWAMVLLGFGGLGLAARYRRTGRRASATA